MAAPKKKTCNGNPFAKFMEHKEHKAYIKSLDYEITFRKLLQHEDDEFNLRLLKGMTKDNQTMNIEEGTAIKYEKVSKCLLDPMVTVKQLKEMDADVGKVLIEIIQAIEQNDMTDDEGNSES